MRYLELAPAADLAPWVRTYWWLDGGSTAHPPEPALPDGSPELIINLGDPWRHHPALGRPRVQPPAFLVGQITAPMAVAPTGRVALVAVRFEAHGAALLAPDLARLTDTWVTLGRLPGRPLAALRERLREERGPGGDGGHPDAARERSLLDAELRALVARRAAEGALPDAVVGAAVAGIRGSRGAVEIDALARGSGLTARSLQRRFARTVGLSPKMLARIVRFQQVFAAWRDDPSRLSRVALECGYFDQSHLVRDFRDFAGAPPAGFLAAMPAFTANFTAARGGAPASRPPRRAPRTTPPRTAPAAGRRSRTAG